MKIITNSLLIFLCIGFLGIGAQAQSAEGNPSPAPKTSSPETKHSSPSHSSAKPKNTASANSTSASAKAKSSPSPHPATKESAPAPQPSVAVENTATPQPETKKDQLPFKLNDRAETETEAPSMTGLLFRTFGALIFIVGLIAAAGWGLRHFGIVKFGKEKNDSVDLNVLHTVALGDRRSLSIVKFGERTLLIGSTAQGITLLAEQDHYEARDEEYQAVSPTAANFYDGDSVDHFEEEMARASLLENTWSDRRN